MADSEVVPTLTQDERTVLMIAAGGESMMPLGRWKPTVENLISRGLMRAADEWNVYITSDGRKVIEAVEKAVDAEVISVFKKVAEQTRGLVETAPYGASIINGKLFFKLLDGSTVTCECIGEPYASKIVEACRATRDH